MIPDSSVSDALVHGLVESDAATTLHLKVLLPSEVLLDEDVVKVIAEAENGSFCLLPRHIDFVASLVPSVLSYCPTKVKERYVALDHGVLVKCGREILVSTLHGILGDDLEKLRALVQETFFQVDEHERQARTALARLEAATLRGFREALERRHG